MQPELLNTCCVRVKSANVVFQRLSIGATSCRVQQFRCNHDYVPLNPLQRAAVAIFSALEAARK